MAHLKDTREMRQMTRTKEINVEKIEETEQNQDRERREEELKRWKKGNRSKCTDLICQVTCHLTVSLSQSQQHQQQQQQVEPLSFGTSLSLKSNHRQWQCDMKHSREDDVDRVVTWHYRVVHRAPWCLFLLGAALLTSSLLHNCQAAESSRLSNSTVKSHRSLSGWTFGGTTFDPRVSAKCERNLMHITVQYEQPFHGIVHVRNHRRSPCQQYGNGSLVTQLTIDLLAHPNRANYCGVQRVKGTEERSISLVVRLHRALELSDDKHFVITCGNSEFYNRNKNEKLVFKFVDAHGHRLTKLYQGEPYRLRAEIISSSHTFSSTSSQSERESNLSTGSLGPSFETSRSFLNLSSSTYQLYVKNCVIFNGNDSEVEFVDSNGCPTVSTVSPFRQIGDNIAEAEISSMFKLPSTSQLHLQCLFELIEHCTFCESSLCPMVESPQGSNETRKSKDLKPVEMQMLASLTAYVFEPDQQLSASLLTCNEWRFPWLIALCIMLAILLLIMLVVNIFLCTSVSCSCFKSEMVEQERSSSTMLEDYDPYKIDFGSYYSPYDSRLSLNRNYAPSYESSDHQAQRPSREPILLQSYSPPGDSKSAKPSGRVSQNRINSRSGRSHHPGPVVTTSPTSQIYNPYDHSPRSIRSQEFY